MRKILVQNQMVLSCLALGLVTLAAPSTVWAAQARKNSIGPTWVRSAVGSESYANATYLNSKRTPARSTLNDDIFKDEAMNRQLRTDFENRAAQHETRTHQGLDNLGDEEAYAHSMRSLAESAMKQVQKIHMRANFKKVRTYAENNFADARDPIAVAAFLGAVYQGTAFRFRLSDEFRMESRTSVRKKEASMNMMLPGLSGGVRYGAADEENLTASVSKSLVDNLSAEVNTNSKGTLQLNYGISF